MLTISQAEGLSKVTMRRRNAALTRLYEGGAPDYEASWAVDLSLLHATANAAKQSTKPSSRSAAEFAVLATAITTAITTADAARYPYTAHLGDDLLSSGSAERFEWGLEGRSL